MNFRSSCRRMSRDRKEPDGQQHGVAELARRASMPMLVQFAKFGIVGISNTLITFTLYTLLLKVFGVWYLAAAAIGFVAGAVNGFLLNRRWTFRGHVGDSLTPVRWAIVQGCGLGINIGLLFLLVHEAGFDELVGQLLTIGVVTPTT